MLYITGWKQKVCALVAIAGAIAFGGHARSTTLGELPQYEQQLLASSCKNPVFNDTYLHREDLNYDKREDLILSGGAVSCDGQPPADCTVLGCPFRIYAQNRDGSFEYTGEVNGYSYKTQYRFGVKIMLFRVPGNECEQASVPADCTFVVRLQGTDLRLLSRERAVE